MVGGLLFLAFALFAVGMASATRSTAQGAADAAALAAAQEARRQLTGQWLDALDDPAAWQAILDGGGDVLACGEAEGFAARNGARLTAPCRADMTPWLTYGVEVETIEPIGASVVPGTEGKYAKADARAVVEPLCTVGRLPPEPTPSPSPSPSATPDPDPGEGEGPRLPTLVCQDRIWDLGDDPHDLPEAKDLFEVRLVD